MRHVPQAASGGDLRPFSTPPWEGTRAGILVNAPKKRWSKKTRFSPYLILVVMLPVLGGVLLTLLLRLL